jgi:hypothetical protein
MGLPAAIFQASQQYQEGMEDARDAETNAFLASMSAADAASRGEEAAGRIRMAASKLVGQQQVAAAVSGTDTSVGANADVIAETRALSEYDAQLARNNGLREAWGYKVEGYQRYRQAQRARQRAVNQAVGTVLGGLVKTGEDAANIAIAAGAL